MVINSLLDFYNTLPPGNLYRETILYLMKLLPSLKGQSIHALAEACYTNASTLSRLAKLIGCASFAEFRTELMADYAAWGYSNEAFRLRLGEEPDVLASWAEAHRRIIDEVCASVSMEMLDGIAGDLARADRCFFCIPGQLDPVSRDLQYEMMIRGKEASVIPNFPQNMLEIIRPGPKDLFVLSCISAPIPAYRCKELLRGMRGAGAKTLLIADRAEKDLLRESDHAFAFTPTQSGNDLYFFLYLTELLLLQLKKYLPL